MFVSIQITTFVPVVLRHPVLVEEPTLTVLLMKVLRVWLAQNHAHHHYSPLCPSSPRVRRELHQSRADALKKADSLCLGSIL
jgi:hypothetical protein